MRYKTIFIICISFFLFGKRSAIAQADTFYYTGSMQTWTVPSCTFVATIDCYGAQGISAAYENYPGYGGEARGVLSVTPGQTYNIFVGGQSGWNGGGSGQMGANGGDGSDVRYPGTSLADRIIVAGGGGGSGGDNWQCKSGTYGNGGGGIAVGSNFVGGGGGWGYGGCGGNGGSNGGFAYLLNCHGGGAGGGGLNTGGAGSKAACGPWAGDSGSLGQGGAVYISSYCTLDKEGTGGGGGGYYGGGGTAGYNCGGGQGGGGSSWTGTLTSPYFNSGAWTGNGEIIITYSSGFAVLSVTASVQNSPICGICNGSITAAATGGGKPYTYSWAPSGQTTATATGLCANTYTITVTDSCGDLSTASIVLAALPLSVSAAVTANNKCSGNCNGDATATVNIGTSPYAYDWSPGGGTAANATGLCTGNYTVTVTDKNGCTGTAGITITEPPAIVPNISAQTNILCNGAATGSATVKASGGVAPYTYKWSPTNQTTATATGLSAGIYALAITDNNACTATISATITEPTQVTTTFTINNVLCYGGVGSATVSASGGVSPYTYLWTPTNQATVTATGLSIGTYAIKVTDNNGCTLTNTITITQPAVLSVTTTNTHASCNLPNGTATASVTGGTGPYTYSWNPSGQTTAKATGLFAGSFTVTVTDNHHCTTSASVSVTQPTLVTATINSVTNVSCYNGTNGSATITGNGGTPPYTYLWSPGGNTNANATGLFALSYTATVTDNNGCSASATTTLTEPTQVTASISEPKIICKDSTGILIANGSGGTAPYKYNWSSGATDGTATITPIATNDYSVIVTDSHGCTASANIVLQYGPAFAVDITGKKSVCVGDSTLICADAIGAIDGVFYQWAPLNSTDGCILVSPGIANVYTVTVVDGCGSTTTATTTLTGEPSPVVNMGVNFSQGCVPFCVQFINQSTLSKGQVAQYVWDFGLASGERDSSREKNPIYCYKTAGEYNVSLTVVSDIGCSATLKKINMVSIYAPPKADFTYSPNPTTIEAPTIQFTDKSKDFNGNNVIYWTWNFGDRSDSISNMENPTHTYQDTGTYCVNLMVMSREGCTDTTTNCLIIEPDFKLYIPSAFTPNADGKNETFQPVGQYVKTFEMYIFNRWGEQIFHATDLKNGWNGEVNGTGQISPEDVYIYKIMVTDAENNFHSYIGNVTLLK